MKKLLLPLLCLAMVMQLSAQSNLEGFILDKESNKPIAFAYLGIKGNATAGTASNEEGFFRLDVSKISSTDSILISHINYVSQTLPVDALPKGNAKILMTENSIQLSELQVSGEEDYEIFKAAVIETKKNLLFPLTTTIYYRELVKENKAYNKYSDGILTVVYERKGDNSNSRIRVNQSRAFKLPKEEDQQLELISPIKVEKIVETEFINFLGRLGEKDKVNYHYYFLPDNSRDNDVIIVEPKKEADRSDDQLLFRSVIKVDKSKNITEVEMKLDSLCNFEKSILGLKYAITNAIITVSIKKSGNFNYVALSRFNFVMRLSTKKFTQTEDFVSEFVTLDAKPGAEEIRGGDVFRKSALYKNGNKYDKPFWQGINLPVLSKEEDALVADLEKKEKIVEKK